MSYDAEPRLDAPSVSKIELTRNAKGDPQWRIVVVQGTSDDDLNLIREQAVRQHQELLKELFQ